MCLAASICFEEPGPGKGQVETRLSGGFGTGSKAAADLDARAFSSYSMIRVPARYAASTALSSGPFPGSKHLVGRGRSLKQQAAQLMKTSSDFGSRCLNTGPGDSAVVKSTYLEKRPH